MSPDIQAVIRMQSLDVKAAALQKEIAELPKHIAQIEKALDQHIRKLDVDRAALAANQRERKRLEDDIKVQDQKISKLKDQTLQAKTNDQYRAFQHEIEFCQNEIRKAEDKILELMGQADPLDKNVKAAEAALAQEKKQVDLEKERARERTAQDQQFYNEAMAERTQIAAGIDKRLVADYERIRKRRGTAIAEAVDGRCTACQISLRPQYFQDLKKAEKVLYCETCGRILYYNPPVSLDHEIHQSIKT